MAQKNGEFTDVESLLTNSMNQMVNQAKPHFDEGGRVRGMLEERAMSFTDRAKNFVLNELNTTSSKLLRAIEADEASILLEFNNAVESSFPPVPVMLAGLLSPTILTLNGLFHTIQLFVLFMPLTIASAWAVYTDWGAVCNIPGMIAWMYAAFFVSFFLTVGNICLMNQVNGGLGALKAKSKEIRDRIEHNAADGETDFKDMQEIFIGHNVLVQQALLTEDKIRRSFWHDVVGAGTFLWLIVSVWNFVVVIGWTFMPHQVAFHVKAAVIDGVPNPEYCGAWASVFVARVVCMIVPIFFVLNILQVIGWILNSLVNSSAFVKGVLGAAEAADRSMTGLPIVQQIVKAFVLRGSTDVKPAALTVASSEQVRLTHEHAEVCDQLDALNAKLSGAKGSVRSLQRKAEKFGASGIDGYVKQLGQIQALKNEDWKQEGQRMVSHAQAEAIKAQQIATDELDKLTQQLMDAAEAVQNSEVVKNTIAQAREAAEKAKIAAAEAQVEAQRLAIEAQKQAEKLAELAMEQAEQLAEQLPDAEEVQRMAEQAKEKAVELGEQAKEKAVELGEQAKEQAVVIGEQAKEAGAQASEQAQVAASKAKGEAEKVKKSMK